MGTRSYIVRGKGSEASWMSCSHGAGRRHSRTRAKKLFTTTDLSAQMAARCGSPIGPMHWWTRSRPPTRHRPGHGRPGRPGSRFCTPCTRSSTTRGPEQDDRLGWLRRELGRRSALSGHWPGGCDEAAVGDPSVATTPSGLGIGDVSTGGLLRPATTRRGLDVLVKALVNIEPLT